MSLTGWQFTFFNLPLHLFWLIKDEICTSLTRITFQMFNRFFSWWYIFLNWDAASDWHRWTFYLSIHWNNPTTRILSVQFTFYVKSPNRLSLRPPVTSALAENGILGEPEEPRREREGAPAGRSTVSPSKLELWADCIHQAWLKTICSEPAAAAFVEEGEY